MASKELKKDLVNCEVVDALLRKYFFYGPSHPNALHTKMRH